MTNALSHERMTPLNSIINGCEFVDSLINKKDSKLYFNVRNEPNRSIVQQKNFSMDNRLLGSQQKLNESMIAQKYLPSIS